MSLPFYIGFRYTRAKRRSRFISLFSLVSILSIALGVMTLITVISVMNGFEKELRERMLGMAPHIELLARDGSFAEWRELSAQIRAALPTQVTGVTPVIEAQGMLSVAGSVRGTLIHGLYPETASEVSDVAAKLVSGSLENLEAGTFNVLIGAELAYVLGVEVGDKITLVVPQASVTPVGVLPRMKRLTVGGIFRVGMHEFDSAMALLHMDDLSKILRLPDGHVQGLNIKLKDMFSAPAMARELAAQLPHGYSLYDWTYRHRNFFRALKTERVMMFIILSLIIGVGAFNIVSTLTMVVTDKQSDIAILRTLGATPVTIMNIFMVQGTLIGVIGTLLGVIAGISLALNVETIVAAIEQYFHVKFLPAEVYYISDVPSELRWPHVFLTAGIALLFSMLATLYPAWRAARTQPAEALRYE
jgi:lipoprotein-releasing system permease protein